MRCTCAPAWRGRLAVAGRRRRSLAAVRSCTRPASTAYRGGTSRRRWSRGHQAECGVAAETSLARPLGPHRWARGGRWASAGDSGGRELEDRGARCGGRALGSRLAGRRRGHRASRPGCSRCPTTSRAPAGGATALPPGTSRRGADRRSRGRRVERGRRLLRLRSARAGDRIQVATRERPDDELSRRLHARHTPRSRSRQRSTRCADEARLVLVTCGRPFNQPVGRYGDNIVVTAVPV